MVTLWVNWELSFYADVVSHPVRYRKTVRKHPLTVGKLLRSKIFSCTQQDTAVTFVTFIAHLNDLDTELHVYIPRKIPNYLFFFLSLWCYLRFISILRNVFKFSSGISSKATLAAESSSYIFISSSACWIITQFWHPLMQHNSRGGGGGMGGFSSGLPTLFSNDGTACCDPRK